MRRLFVGIALLVFAGFVLAGCGKAENEVCADVVCPGAGRGECVDLETDSENCGACGAECEPDQTCEHGRCFGCEEGETRCGTVCADLSSSASHCGACWADCGAGEECVNGECQSLDLCGGEECGADEECVNDRCEALPPCGDGACECEEGLSQCGQRCFDLETDARHCGSCSNLCDAGLECVDGQCACPGGMLACWSGCLDPTSDPLNCGACGALCENSTFCEEGECRCPEGLASCDGTCVDLEASRFHCGDCGTKCGETESCVAGSCEPPPPDAECIEVPIGVGIRRVALYQGVEVDLIQSGSPTPLNQRTVGVVRGRDALIRVFVSPALGFSPTTLVARLVLQGAETRTFRSEELLVTQGSTPESLESTLNIFVPGSALDEELEFSVELSACESPASGTVGAVRIPATGTTPLGTRRSGEVVVRFVPVIHDGRAPDTSPAILDVFAREVMRQYPATGLRWDLGEPLVSDQTGIFLDLGLTLDELTARREAENPAENVYYYGIVDPAAQLSEYCDGGCTTGIAWMLTSVNDWAVAHRTGVGIGFGTYGANTFAHELGHNLGRDHAPCGTEGDLTFPYPEASIGVWGYDPVGGVLKDPQAFKDLMGYCEPNWISDYTYRAMFERISAVEAPLSRQMVAEVGKPSARPETWASFIVTEQRVKWARTHTNLGAPTDRPEKGVVYDVDGVPLAEVEVHRLFMGDSGGYKVFVPKKQPGWFAVGLADGISLPYAEN